MFLVTTLSLWLLLPLVQSQAVGRGTEDVWVEGKLGSKVKVFWLLSFLGGKMKVFLVFALFGRQDVGPLVLSPLKHCSTGGTWL